MEIEIPDCPRPSTRGALAEIIKDGGRCEVAAHAEEMTSIMLKGWLNTSDFKIMPSPNPGWVIYVARGRYADLPTHDMPLAVDGMVSYRYRGNYGWIHAAALSHEEALREVDRSLSSGRAVEENLEVWDVLTERYISVLDPQE